MDFELTQEQLMFQRAIRKLAQEWIVPLVDEAEKNHKFPVELFRKMGEQGYLCITYPEEYGALGLGVLEECIWAEELGRVCCGIASALVGHSSLATAIICYHGSQELGRKDWGFWTYGAWCRF
jgi:alkylation response protein AidB-like acyl-CoA dehydrogenase